jgi:hypothetical protein
MPTLHGSVWACRLPLKRLPRTAVLAWWDLISLPGIGIESVVGSPTLSGRKAKIDFARSRSGSLCAPLRAQEEIRGYVSAAGAARCSSSTHACAARASRGLERQAN